MSVCNMIRLIAVDQIPDATPFRVDIDGHEPFCVFRVDGKIYVTDDTCTHGKASLAEEGELDGFVITCTWHDGAYDVRDGTIVQRPCVKPLQAYPATVVDGVVYISLPAEA